MLHLRAMDSPSIYAERIRANGDGTGIADSLLHVHAGMAILLIACLLTKCSLAAPVPLLVVCAAELANEVLDRLDYGSWRWSDTPPDLIKTLFWLTVLFVRVRLRRRRPRIEQNENR
jgi:hypothetical protein